MSDKKILAFFGDPKIKAKYLRRVKAHYKADEIIKGTYWENGKGCAVGCTIEGSDLELIIERAKTKKNGVYVFKTYFNYLVVNNQVAA